jgi:hypothetical protein
MYIPLNQRIRNTFTWFIYVEFCQKFEKKMSEKFKFVRNFIPKYLCIRKFVRKFARKICPKNLSEKFVRKVFGRNGDSWNRFLNVSESESVNISRTAVGARVVLQLHVPGHPLRRHLDKFDRLFRRQNVFRFGISLQQFSTIIWKKELKPKMRIPRPSSSH